MQLYITRSAFILHFAWSLLVTRVQTQTESIFSASNTPVQPPSGVGGPQCCCPPIATRGGMCQPESDVQEWVKSVLCFFMLECCMRKLWMFTDICREFLTKITNLTRPIFVMVIKNVDCKTPAIIIFSWHFMKWNATSIVVFCQFFFNRSGDFFLNFVPSLLIKM